MHVLIFSIGSCHPRHKGKYFSLFGNRFGTHTLWWFFPKKLWDSPTTHASRGASAPDCCGEILSPSSYSGSEWITSWYLFLDTPREASNTATLINLSLPVAINVPSGTLSTPASAVTEKTRRDQQILGIQKHCHILASPLLPHHLN